ncbi:LuxR C-terminal-related transcriptional regulator [Pseudomonas schmalbachii]|uniref:HTH luxR-type domain-containing protein n=1 Tax=Pseudomonas schmalbachii TaxID=2816993 RepID=A0ABS3TQN3_9PSED|nr:LuxR C-terminal-related transcriptional regulator [Pseudomonas schmalbachii]MBO3275663.1 hypothetical protein [Pseudomonas schmalbachii]
MTPSPRVRRSKLAPPLGAGTSLPRQRIVERIRASQHARLVVVQGPAGFGKSTIMRQAYELLRRDGRQVAWLTLDDADNDVGRFISHLAAALENIAPDLAPTLGDDNAIEGAAIDLANRLLVLSSPFTLFLDDFEAIHNPTVLDLVRQIAGDLPAHGQLLIGSRRAPDIGLGRFRAHGQLLEIAAADLRFTPEETSEFLRHLHGLELDDEQLRRLQQRTEGWVTALWLVSLALQGRDDPQTFVDTFDGANAALGEYLLEDVLARQPAALREFLVRSSLLDELCAPLCNHLLERNDSAALLAQVEAAQLFLSPQDTERRWYRYHPLFREFLRNQLRQTEPDSVPLLHRRASAWYAEVGRPIPAIEHALRCADSQWLIGLLERHAEGLLWQGRTRLLVRWFHAPALDGRLQDHPQLLLVHAWGLTLGNHPEQAEPLLRRVRELCARSARDGALTEQADALQAFICAMRDEIAEATRRWQDYAERQSASLGFAYGIFANSYGFCLTAASRFQQARDIIGQAGQSHLRIGDTFVGPLANAMLGAIDLAQGQLRGAIARLRTAPASGSTSAMRHLSGSVVAIAVLAEALYERNELEEAERLLNLYLPVLKEAAAADQLITSYRVLARISRLSGDTERADLLLAELEALGHEKALARLVASARLERSRIALLQGSLQNAADLLDSASSARTWAPFQNLVAHANDIESPALARIRLDLHNGAAAQAASAARQALEQAQALQRQRQALTLRILLGQALCASGETAEGHACLLEALQWAATEGFIRAFADEGPELLALLAELRGSHGAMQDDAQALLDTLLAGHEEYSSKDAGAAAGLLSDRELGVLRLLAEGLRNREIADRLFVSETTVRTHLRNINVKLNSQSRTHAVAIARQLGLLD